MKKQKSPTVSNKENRFGFKLCTLDGIQKNLLDPHKAPNPKDHSLAFREANELADLAYGRKDASAIDLAERLLYLVHAETKFSVPWSPVAGIVWPILMRAKLQGDLPSDLGSMVTVKQFMDGFRAAITQAETDSNLVEEIGKAKDRENMVRYVKNYLAMTGGFTHQLFSIAKVATGKLKSVLIHNIDDEYTDGKEHRDLRYVWPRQLGVNIVPSEIVLDPEYLTETFSVTNFRTGISLLPTPHIGVGVFYSLEGLFPDLATRLRIALKQIGLEEKYLEHLKIHETADIEHINAGLEAICATMTEGRELQLVLSGAAIHVQMRHKMMEAVRRLIGYPSGVVPNNMKKAA